MPAGVKLFKGTRTSPALNAWYLDVDLTKKYVIKPYTTPAGREEIMSFANRYHAVAAVNGGYFDNSTGSIYSAVVQPGLVAAKNVAAVTRSSVSYPVTRSFFGLNEDRTTEVSWIYHFGNRPMDAYRFTDPINNQVGTPAAVPSQTAGIPSYELIAGIGGGPRLVKDGAVYMTYREEVFWGSGVDTLADPRTAIGFTPSRHIILLIADGRQTASAGLSMRELGQVMISLGCTDAMNLDGGGSTQMCAGQTLLNLPDGGGALRTLPAIVAVVPQDSLAGLLPVQSYNQRIDTEDGACTLVGSGWTSSAYAGYYGTSASKVVKTGTGSAYAEYRLSVPKAGTYSIDSWWAPAYGRCPDVPYIISRQNGTDTIRVDQTQNATKWSRIGTFQFTGTGSDVIRIANNATANTYIVADAIRIMSVDSVSAFRDAVTEDRGFRLENNYPNPFNAATVIRYSLDHPGNVSLKLYDVLGRPVAVLAEGGQSAGQHHVSYNAGSLASGCYIVRLETEGGCESRKIVVLK